jgi:hypothetical protein
MDVLQVELSESVSGLKIRTGNQFSADSVQQQLLGAAKACTNCGEGGKYYHD